MADGDWIRSQLIRPPQTLPLHFAEFVTSPTNSRELLFSHIELTGITALTNQFPRFEHFPIDDDAFLSNNVKGLGEISLCVWEGTVGEPCSFPIKEIPEKKVHERSKKAMGHQVKYVLTQPSP